MNVNKALQLASKKLKLSKISSAELDAEVILSYVLKKSKEFLYIHPEKKLTKLQLQKFNQLIKRRQKLKPVAYIVGKKEFYGLEFMVTKNVLIPRPETELLIDEVIHYCQMSSVKCQVLIIDMGTGSGCIAITLKKLLPKTKIYATDISKKVLKVAKINAKKHKVKISFQQGNLLEPIKKTNPNIIIANLPYLNEKIIHNPALKFEPKIALFGGENGLKFYKTLLKQIDQFNLNPKLILCEMDPKQKIALKKIAKKHLPNYKVKIKKDLSGLARLLILRLK